LLGAWFMFALVRELGLSRFAAYVSALCFSLGGFVVRMPWPHMLESSIWLPLVFLYFLRALRSAEQRTMLLNSALSGLMLGMSILAGGMHVVIMQVLLVVSAGAYHALTPNSNDDTTPWYRRSSVRQATTVVATICVVGLAAGAIQLLPSAEYSGHAI